MSRSITVNTGEKIEVKNTDGETMGYFYFNPADPDLMRRCEKAQKEIGEISNGIHDTVTPEEIAGINQALREQMAYVLGESAADTLFKYNSPLALMEDGRAYGVYAFGIIYDFIESELHERMEKSRRISDKYTAKYQA